MIPSSEPLRIFLLLLLMAGCAASVAAQGLAGDLPPTLLEALEPVACGEIVGRVRSVHDGSSIARAHVFVPGLGSGAISDSAGYFRYRSLPPGTHTVRIQAVGFLPEVLPLSFDPRLAYVIGARLEHASTHNQPGDGRSDSEVRLWVVRECGP